MITEDDEDMGDYWREIKRLGQEKREKNRVTY
jgi:hypothetical protein